MGGEALAGRRTVNCLFWDFTCIVVVVVILGDIECILWQTRHEMDRGAVSFIDAASDSRQRAT